MRTQKSSLQTLLLASGIALLLPSLAQAHFSLQQPPNFANEHGPTYAGPQKSVPCGQMDTGDPFEPTNIMTNYKPGQMITITINETIFHPGHYFVQLAQNMAGLPADPTVTAGSTACGSTPVRTNPSLPLLADGLFTHTTSFSGPQTAQIKLPDGYTCQGCILQVVEFMSNHGLNPQGGCYYHHCANVNITQDAPDLGTTPAVDMAAPPVDMPPATPEGCSYTASHHKSATLFHLAPLVALAFLIRRRRRTQ